MNTHDIELPPEFQSGNSVPVSQATIKRERMEEILRSAIEADRQRRGEPVDTDLVQKWQREHGIAPAPGSREAAMVVIRHDEDGKPTVWCDPEIADLVRALNDGGVATVASCSGHGHRPGNIMLADGRVLVVCKDADEAREVTSHFPGINGEAPQPAEPSECSEVVEPVKVPSDDERAAQGLPPYSPRHWTEEERNRLTENGRKAWGKKPDEPEKEPPCET